jgi:RNA polymerase sigma factor (sigma-70 family)
MQTSPETRPSLLLRLRNPQDEQAWREFLEIYEPLIERLARRRGLQHADARELVQEVLLAVSGAIDRWDPDEARGWLSTITRNLTINVLKREGRHARGTGDSEFARLMNEQPDPVGENTALFDLEYRRRLFQFAAEHVQEQFGDSTRQAFWKTSVEQQPLVDVCEELGLSRGAIYVARSRVMAKLRKHIEKLESEV